MWDRRVINPCRISQRRRLREGRKWSLGVERYNVLLQPAHPNTAMTYDDRWKGGSSHWGCVTELVECAITHTSLHTWDCRVIRDGHTVYFLCVVVVCLSVCLIRLHEGEGWGEGRGGGEGEGGEGAVQGKHISRSAKHHQYELS